MLDSTDIEKLRTAGMSWLRKNHSSLSNDDREDVLQDALIELVRATPSDPGALLGTIIDRRTADLLRRKGRRQKVEVAAGDTSDLSILSDGRGLTIDGAIFAADFDRALRDLPEDERDAFILTELRGCTQYETGILLGVTPTTIRNRNDRARELLRKEL